MEIMVYFNSGDKARFDSSKVVFVDDVGDPVHALQNGIVRVNWWNVCFIREVKPKEEDEE